MKWINVKDKLPDNDDMVLIYNTWSGYEIGWYIEKANQWCMSLYSPNRVITHWQELPKKPK